MTGSSATAGKWALTLIIYMLVVFAISYVVVMAMASNNQTVSVTTSALQDVITQQQQLYGVNGYCASPRNSQSSEYYNDRASLSCRGMPQASQSVCNSVPNCNFQNETDWAWSWDNFWFVETSVSVCNGTVDTTWLTNNQTTFQKTLDNYSRITIDSAYLDTYTVFISGSLPYLTVTQYTNVANQTVAVNDPLFFNPIDVCDMPRLQNQQTCQQFGCTWITPQQVEIEQSLNFAQIIAFMFGFNISIGALPTSLALWVSLLFVWLPLIALTIAIYVAIKGF